MQFYYSRISLIGHKYRRPFQKHFSIVLVKLSTLLNFCCYGIFPLCLEYRVNEGDGFGEKTPKCNSELPKISQGISGFSLFRNKYLKTQIALNRVFVVNENEYSEDDNVWR